MLFICGMILPDENFSEVSTPNGVLLSDGTRQLVFFAGVPSMNNDNLGLTELGIPLTETLGGSEYTVTASREFCARQHDVRCVGAIFPYPHSSARR